MMKFEDELNKIISRPFLNEEGYRVKDAPIPIAGTDIRIEAIESENPDDREEIIDWVRIMDGNEKIGEGQFINGVLRVVFDRNLDIRLAPQLNGSLEEFFDQVVNTIASKYDLEGVTYRVQHK